MKCIKTVNDIKSLGTIFGVWAHPDDETFSMGGIMAAAADNGQLVACVTATKGEQGVQDESRWPAQHLASIRERELAKAFEIFGVKNHHWLNYPDGGCDCVDEHEAAGKIAEIIKIYQPDTILSFGPDGMTGHDDHVESSKWAILARDMAGSNAKIYHAINTEQQYEASKEADEKLDIYFNIEQPVICPEEKCDICFELPDKILNQKIRALKVMESQTEILLREFGDNIKDFIGTEAYVLMDK